jgi:hypothetical protein
LTVTPDTTPPQVSIISPASGAAVSGSTMLQASATGSVAIAGVQFTLNGTNVAAEVTGSGPTYNLMGRQKRREWCLHGGRSGP